MKLENNHKIIVFIIGFISTQRFLLSEIYAYICLIPLLYFIYYSFKTKQTNALAYLFIAILSMVDNGGTIYTETHSILRYVIYIISYLYLLSRMRGLNYKYLSYYLFWVTIVLILTILNIINGYSNFSTLINDLIIISLVSVIFCGRIQLFIDKKDYDFILVLLLSFCFGLILSELINVLFFMDITRGYLNYQSTKAIIMLPLIYFLLKKKIIFSILISLATVIILLNYVTRMIILSFLFALLLYIIFYLFKPKFSFRKINFVKFFFYTFFLIILIGVLFYNLQDTQFSLDSNKMTSMFLNFYNSTSLIDTIRILDPVRYVELKIVFNGELINILFGNGLGAAYFDYNNLFGFLGSNGFAFSEQELKTNVYYNFHDVWTDIAYRLGFLPVLLMIYYLSLKIGSNNFLIRVFSFLTLILFFCAFWNKSGIILIFMLLALISTLEHLVVNER